MIRYNACMGVVETGPVNCGQCGHLINESPHMAAEDRLPCPACGSTTRHIEVRICLAVETHSDLGLKHRRLGAKRPISEQKHGDSFSKRLGRWMRRSRVVDRENNRYIETVIDPQTGEAIHHCDEPLSDHQGHGSAKASKR